MHIVRHLEVWLSIRNTKLTKPSAENILPAAFHLLSNRLAGLHKLFMPFAGY